MPHSSVRTSTSRVHKYSVNRSTRQSLTLPQLQRFGFTHPRDGCWLMQPKEFADLVAYETKAVVQVVLEVLGRTIGVPGDGPHERALWVELSTYDCAATGRMSHSAAQRGLATAVHKGYLRRKVLETDYKGDPIRHAYSLKWKGIDN